MSSRPVSAAFGPYGAELDRQGGTVMTISPEKPRALDAPAAGWSPVDRPVRQRNGYEHLAPLFVERARLPDGHPRRAALRSALIVGYQPVAQHIARKYVQRAESLDDLEQVATLGLILAVDRFEPEREVDFLSYAVPTITGELLRHFRDRSTTIRVPRRLRDAQRDIFDAVAELAQRHGRTARPSELAAFLGVDGEVVLEALQAQQTAHPASLDEPAWNEDGGSGDRSRFAPALGRVESAFDLVDCRESIAPLFAALPERERRILFMRFVDGLTQTEIGLHVGISQMHVSRLLSRTLARLRRAVVADR